MPIYEFRCNSCRRRVSLLVRSYSTSEARCPFCGSQDLFRLISPFAVLRSEESRLEELSDVSKLGGLEDNPAALARWAKRLGGEMGGDLGPDFEEMVDRMEAGEMPEENGGDEPLEE